MKVQFDRDTLLAALAPAAAIASTQNTMASIEGILFECPGPVAGTCQLTAYDKEKGLRTAVEATVLQEGRFILNGKSILQYVTKSPGGMLQIEVDERGRAHISSGMSAWEENALPGEDFPALPLLTGERNYTLPQYVLRSLINKTIFATAPSAQKPIFTGVYFSVKNGKLRCVGCDGNRLGLAEAELDAAGEETSFIVPGKILQELLRQIKDSEDEITVSLARKHVIFQIGEFTYFSRLIDGEYLNYERILPEHYEKTAVINTFLISHAIERASIVAENKIGGSSSKTFVKLEFSDGLLRISSTTTGSNFNEKLPIRMEGEDLVIGFNCRYLMDALKVAGESDSVCFKMNGPLMGISIEAAQTDEDEEKDPVSFTLFVMPLRMNQ